MLVDSVVLGNLVVMHYMSEIIDSFKQYQQCIWPFLTGQCNIDHRKIVCIVLRWRAFLNFIKPKDTLNLIF